MRRKSSLPSKSEIFEYWKERIFEKGLFIDWGEPSCWVCGLHYDSKYDISSPDTNWERILRCWEKIPLQRCHIVPRSLGGKDSVENIFLMCRECHDLAPNTAIVDLFFEWARSQSWLKRETAKINQALESFSLDKDDYDSLFEMMNSPEFRLWVRDKIGLHWPQSNYAPRSSRLTPATLVGLVVFYRRNNQSSLNTPLEPIR